MLMKTLLPFSILMLIVLSSCRIPILSVVNEKIEEPYRHPTFIVLYDSLTQKFCESMKSELDIRFEPDTAILLRANDSRINVLSDEQIDSLCRTQLNDSQTDVAILINPTYIVPTESKALPSNNQPLKAGDIKHEWLSEIMFQLVALDTKTRRNVWSAAHETSLYVDSLAIGALSNKTARKIQSQLLRDKILKWPVSN